MSEDNNEEKNVQENPVIPKDLWCEAMNEYAYKKGLYSYERYMAIKRTIPKYFRKEIEERKQAEAEKRRKEREERNKNATED